MKKIPENSGVQLNLLPAKVQCIVLLLWFQHFYEVVNLDCTDVETSVQDGITNEVDVELHGVSDEVYITHLEVLGAFRALKNSKAPGPDGFIGEFYKCAAPCDVEFLTQYFNKLFDTVGWSG